MTVGSNLIGFFKSLPANIMTLLRMIFLDCAVPIVFMLIFDFLAQIIKAILGVILTAWSINPVVIDRVRYAVATLAAQFPLLVVCLQRREPILQSFHPPRSMAAAMTIGLGLLALNLTAQIGVVDIGLELSLSAGLAIISVCLLTPFCEELFFRGYLWARLQARGYSDGLITICTALVFAAVHAPVSLASLFNYLLMAFSFSLIRYFSGGIRLSIFFHAAMNFIVIRHIGV